jgi:hypothetical protein
VDGANARAYRQPIRALPGVSLVFPVGQQLKVWLTPGQSQTDFDNAIANVAPQLRSQILEPTLNDVALRDLNINRSDGH